MLDPYYLLGVELNATPDEIRTAYRRRAAEVHPDIQPPERRAWASERMKQLNAARDLLLDPKRRIEYDEHMRLEMEKAKWRARRDAYARPADFRSPRRQRRGRMAWAANIVLLGWLMLICVYTLPLLIPASQRSQFASLQEIYFALQTVFVLMLTSLGLWLGPLFITLLLVAIFHYWKN
jgi:curved DNA-binding protein CbpA